MKRLDLEHVVRAAGAISGAKELVIIGSQSILGSYPDAPVELLKSQELDLYPKEDPSKADLIDGSIGELSPFHSQFGYYAHGIGPETATLPKNWESRLVRVANPNTSGVVALCLHPLDLALSKLCAGREKDLEYVSEMLRFKLAESEDLFGLCSELPLDARELAQQRLTKISSD